MPTLLLHGDDDQIVPIVASALLSSNLIMQAELKIYEPQSPGEPGFARVLKGLSGHSHHDGDIAEAGRPYSGPGLETQ